MGERVDNEENCRRVENVGREEGVHSGSNDLGGQFGIEWSVNIEEAILVSVV